MFGGDVSVEYRSFERGAGHPGGLSETNCLFRHKRLPPEQVERMLGDITALAAAEGLSYDFTRLSRSS